ncbi:MAG: glutamate mutase L, partial [Bacillota bacterium]
MTKAKRNAMLIDFGSTFTKVTAVDMEAGRLLGTARAATTVDEDITIGLEAALSELGKQIGRLEYEVKLACSSAAGGLRIVAIGLVPELTAQAASMAALGAGAKVLRTFSYEIGEEEITQILELRPEIILLAGGTDGGNQ